MIKTPTKPQFQPLAMLSKKVWGNILSGRPGWSAPILSLKKKTRQGENRLCRKFYFDQIIHAKCLIYASNIPTMIYGQSDFIEQIKKSLVDTLGFAHSGLDVEGFDVLPVLLEKRNQKVDRQVQVGNQLVVRHINVSDSNGQAEDLSVWINRGQDSCLNFNSFTVKK